MRTCFLPDAERRPRPTRGGAGRDRTDDPLLAKQVLSQLSYGPKPSRLAAIAGKALVGLGRLELPTSRLSGVRSNRLSYRPCCGRRDGLTAAPRIARLHVFRQEGKRNEDGDAPP